MTFFGIHSHALHHYDVLRYLSGLVALVALVVPVVGKRLKPQHCLRAGAALMSHHDHSVEMGLLGLAVVCDSDSNFGGEPESCKEVILCSQAESQWLHTFHPGCLASLETSHEVSCVGLGELRLV